MLMRRWIPSAAIAETHTAEWKQWCIGSMLWEMNTKDGIVHSYRRVSAYSDNDSIVETLEDLGESTIPLEAIVSNHLPFTQDTIGSWKIKYVMLEDKHPPLPKISEHKPHRASIHISQSHLQNRDHREYGEQREKREQRAPQNHLLTQKTRLSNHIPNQQPCHQEQKQRQSHKHHAQRSQSSLDTSVPLFQDD